LGFNFFGITADNNSDWLAARLTRMIDHAVNETLPAKMK